MGNEAEEKVGTTEVASEAQAKGSEEQTKQPPDEKGKSKDTEYEKQQQQLDQERANNRRLREALETATGERDELQEQLTGLQGEVADLKGQIKQHVTAKEYQDLANLDPETTDVPDLVKALQANLKKTQGLEELLVAQQKRIQAFEQRDEQAQQVKAKNATVEAILQHCDEQYGAKYRNDAYAMANDLVENGEVEQPSNVLEGVKLMERCYREVKAKDKPKETHETKKTVPTDTGLRGLSLSQIEDTDDELGTGTIEEIKAKMLKQAKAGKLKLTGVASSP